MNWVVDLFWNNSVSHSILIYSLVISTGVLLGKIKIRGVSLGVAFVLFTGIFAGHFGLTVNQHVLEFIKDFGLVLFVFFIGLQVGPGFFSSLKKGGITLNMMAVLIVILGAATTIALHFISGVSMPVMTGIMSGAVTNTPGLGAAQEAFQQISLNKEGLMNPDLGLGYAVAYPFGVLGILLTIIILQRISKTNIKKEVEIYEQRKHPKESEPERINISVENPEILGKQIKDLDYGKISDAVISRILQNGEIKIAKSETILNEGDIILIIAQKGSAKDLIKIFGKKSNVDIFNVNTKLISSQVMVTNQKLIGKSLSSLKLRSRFGINITRVYRSGIELIASPNLNLQMGDKLTIVGDETSIEEVSHIIGNSIKRLNEPNLFPIFTGIILGVLVGSIPIVISGIPTPIKLGMAGGPLVIAILLSRYGYLFSLNAYTTPSANAMLRELGIVLFLSSVGLKAGSNFIPSLISGDGFIWMGYGAIITFIPIFIVGLITKFVLKLNFLEICGLISGSMTDPPALAFSNSLSQSDTPAIAYATVYPLVMFLRVITAQLLILFFT